MVKTNKGIPAVITGSIMAVIGGFLALVMIVVGSSGLTEFTGTISGDPSDVYDLGNVLVVDQYGYIEGDSLDEDYYLIAFTHNGTDDIYFASLYVNESMDVFERLDDYAYDDSMLIGDLYLQVCASAEMLSDIDSDMRGFYYDALDVYGEMMPGYIDSGISFSFYCEGASAFPSALKEEQSTNNVLTVIFAAVFAIGIVLIITGAVSHSKAKTALEALQQQGGAYYNPQGTYYYPQPGADPYQQQGTWSNGANQTQPNPAQQGNYYAPPGQQAPQQPQGTESGAYYRPQQPPKRPSAAGAEQPQRQTPASGAPGALGRNTENDTILLDDNNPYYIPPQNGGQQ